MNSGQLAGMVNYRLCASGITGSPAETADEHSDGGGELCNSCYFCRVFRLTYVEHLLRRNGIIIAPSLRWLTVYCVSLVARKIHASLR